MLWLSQEQQQPLSWTVWQELMTLPHYTAASQAKMQTFLLQNLRPSISLLSKRFIQTTFQLRQTEGEKRIAEIIKASHLNPTEIEVKDISGGCGSMYEIHVTSKEFKGKRTVQQHRIVNEILKEEVEQMHGVRINTEVPEGS